MVGKSSRVSSRKIQVSSSRSATHASRVITCPARSIVFLVFSGCIVSSRPSSRDLNLTCAENITGCRTLILQKILMLPAHTQIATQSGGQMISTGVISMSMMANTMKKHNLIPHQMNQRIFNAILLTISSKFCMISWGRKKRTGREIIMSSNVNKRQIINMRVQNGTIIKYKAFNMNRPSVVSKTI